MKLWEIFRFETMFQARRPTIWIFFVALLALTFRIATEAYVAKARNGGYLFNAPILLAEITLMGSLLGLLVATVLAGDAGGRDVQTRMHPLMYTTPVGKPAYLRGRFLAAFTVNALVLLAIPIGLLLATLSSRVEPELLGPFRPAAYLGAYFIFALPNAFVATALLFMLAALSRRGMTSYLGAVLLFFATVLSWQLLAVGFGRWELATLTDPIGLTAVAELARVWTPADKSALLVPLEGGLLANRLLWMGIALAGLAATHLGFRFVHPAATAGWRRRRPRSESAAGRSDAGARAAPIAAPSPEQSFGFTAHARQALAIAGVSFRSIAGSWGGLVLAAMAALLVLTTPQVLQHLGVPLIPTTRVVAAFLASSLTSPQDLLWMIVPLLVVFYAGELVWREREAGMGEITDAAPVPDWVPLAGKLLGLGLVMAGVQAMLIVAGILVQTGLGYQEFEIGLYARLLFGFPLVDYLLFAVLAVVVHALVNQKHLGHLVMLTAYAFMAFAPAMGIHHRMLVYAADPGWSYSDLRGFEPYLGPVLWFKLYWAAWALLLAIVARIFWPRGRERLARRPLTRGTVTAAGVASGLVLLLGGFVFHNTNVRNEYRTPGEVAEGRAEYERRYGALAASPQPRLTATSLRIELHPRNRAAEIRGFHRLVNAGAAAIDTIYLTTARSVETTGVRFDRPASRLTADARFGHHAYLLASPLRPGDSLRVDFAVRHRSRGFTNQGADASVVPNGTFFSPGDWIPAVGYQAGRELSGPGERREHGLPPRPAIPPLDDPAARMEHAGRIALEVVVGTEEGQTAIAPGRLRRSWVEGGRRYFHYATDAPIANDWALFSARYAVRAARWKDVAIEVVHHPGHDWNVDRMVRSVQASLDYHTERFGPYPHGQIRLVEYAERGNGLHAAPVNIWYKEDFSVLDPAADPRSIDFPFAIVAHEVAHQWWGNQLTPAWMEGGALLTESLAWYSALGVVEAAHGSEHLRRFLEVMRTAYLDPRARADVPLIRADDWFLGYRKGPFAMYALREYVGADRVDGALRRLLEEHRSGEAPRATARDLVRELRAVTPDSLQPLVTDLFERNTFWELAAESATAEPTADGAWRVTLDVRARKVAVDTLGVETVLPMDEMVEVGVYPAGEGAGSEAPLYLRMHRVRGGEQRITVVVPREPGRAGIDPRGLLIDEAIADNTRPVERGGGS